MDILIKLTLILGVVLGTKAVLNGKFIILGDIHLDPTYLAVGESCNMVIPKEERQANPYGHYECDGTTQIMESACKKINQLKEGVDFVVFAGDIVEHVREKNALNESKALDIIRNAFYELRQMIDSNLPIVPVFGNHDYFPKSQLPPTTNDLFMGKAADIFAGAFNFTTAEKESFKKGGYYSRELASNLVLLVLNTNLYRPKDLLTDPAVHPDPVGQFAWMRQQLSSARNKGQKVLMLIHVPPGVSEADNQVMMKPEYNKAFNGIIMDYTDIIMTIQAAHTHTDSFRIYYKDDKPAVGLLLGPSVTQWRRLPRDSLPRNPAFRVVIFNSVNLKMVDYIQYYANLEDANKYKEVIWQPEYQFTIDFKAKDISPESLHKVLKSFQKKESKEFAKYHKYNSVSISESDRDLLPKVAYECDCLCKAIHICSITKVDGNEYNDCLDKERKSCDEEMKTRNNEVNNGSESQRSALCLNIMFGTVMWIYIGSS